MALSSISSAISTPKSVASSLGTPDSKPAEAHPHETFTPGTAPAPDMKAAAAAGAQAPDPTQDAQEIPGFFKLLKKNDKIWFAISPEQLKKPFFFSANVAQSLGEKNLVGSEMGDSQLAEFRLAGSQIQLVAKNTSFFAEAGTPQEQFVKEDFADSLLASAPVVASKRPNGEIVVEANALLFTDIPAYQARLAHTYDTPFGLDVKNTSFTSHDSNEQQTSFGVQANYQAPAIPPKTGALPSTTPDPRSALVEFRYSFSKLPDVPMTPRLADDRIGHFVTTRKDYTGDDSDGKVRYVNRWLLEKKDPAAPLSEPVQPITYWVAKDVPEKYRESVKAGVLEWNKAFEKIGFKDAIVVQQQNKDDKFDTMDARHASIRWYTAADVGSAVGPSQVDPRSGEILDADIRMADVFGRSAQKFLVDNPPAEPTHDHAHGDHQCEYLHHAGAEQAFARELLEARGDNEAGQKLAQAYIKDVVMHEVGHTLGLRHNFKGSLANDNTQLQDADHTKEHGLGTSVMDYHPFNLAAPGEKQGEYVQSSLGKYDYLAIKYAYEPLAADREKDALSAIAEQTTTDPQLAYESDEAADASDPEVNRFDLGSDPLAFAQKQVVLGKELWKRAQDKVLPEGAPYQELTGAFLSGLNKMSSAGTFMTRYIGGVTLNRDHAGTDKATYEPVPAEKQRQAFQSILSTYFQPDSFKFKPDFVARLARDRFETWGDQNIFVGKAVVGMQAGVINKLLATDRAQRLIDAPEKLADGTDTMSLGEIYDGLQTAIFSEVAAKKEISQPRRDLQREYIKAVLPILSPESKAPGDAVSMARYQANQLKKQIDAAASGSLSLQTRAHLENCSQMLNRALNPDK